jgi:hypothetical protein
MGFDRGRVEQWRHCANALIGHVHAHIHSSTFNLCICTPTSCSEIGPSRRTRHGPSHTSRVFQILSRLTNLHPAPAAPVLLRQIRDAHRADIHERAGTQQREQRQSESRPGQDVSVLQQGRDVIASCQETGDSLALGKERNHEQEEQACRQG